MSQYNFQQLSFLSKHKPNTALSSHIDSHAFLNTFLAHVSEQLEFHEVSFSLETPLLDPDFHEICQSNILLNEFEIGELALLFHSNSEELSLIYFSPSGLISSELFCFHEFFDFTVSDYVILVCEYCTMLLTFLELYK